MKIRLLLLAALAATTVTPAAFAVGRIAEVEILDRGTGRTLTVHRHRGEYWVEGRPGARYAIRIRNPGGERLLAVTSVDGVNVVTGETAAVDQRGYVFDPGAGYDIAGWRKSDAEIAAFEFTAVPRSYAARTGRPDNVGVIGVAVFRERPVPPPAITLPERAAESAAAPAQRADADAAGSARGATREFKAQRAPSLGTGHGPRESSWTRQVAFERARPTPDEIIRVRYDSRAGLVALGVIREPRPAPVPDAFPGGSAPGYVPDP